MSKLVVGVGVAGPGEAEEPEDVAVDRRLSARDEVVLWVYEGPPAQGMRVARMAACWPREADEPTVEVDLVEEFSIMRELPPGSASPAALICVKHHPRYQTRHRPMPSTPEELGSEDIPTEPNGCGSDGAGSNDLYAVIQVDGQEALPRLQPGRRIGLFVFGCGPDEDEVAAKAHLHWTENPERRVAEIGPNGNVVVYRPPPPPRIGMLARLKRLLGLGQG